MRWAAAVIAGMVLLCSLVANADDSIGFVGRVREQTPELELCRKSRNEAGKTRASEHYKRGVQLYEQGDYKYAVREFVTAYCHRPHHAMLKNIAQAFERQVEYGKAVAYLRRYVLELPDGNEREAERTSFRIQILERMPARVTVATAPPGAKVTLVADAGIAATGIANSEDQVLVTRGRYTMRIELAGFKILERSVDFEIGRPYSYYFQLDPLVSLLRISAEPSNSRIFLEREETGIQSLVGIGGYEGEVPLGRYQVTVEANNRPTKIQAVSVTSGEVTDVAMKLAPAPRTGRWELVGGATVLGGALGSSALQSLFDDDDALAVLGGALGLGVGFIGSYVGVPEQTPVGVSSLILGSTAIAAIQGALVANFFACTADRQPDGDIVDDCSTSRSDIVSGVALASAMVGAFAGAALAGKLEPTAGDVALVNSGALWGGVAGMLLYTAFDDDPRLLEPLVLAGMNMGLLSATVMSTRSEIGRSRMALIDLAGLAGIVAGASIAQVIAGNGSERVSHFALVGMGTGLVGGALLTRFWDEPNAPTVQLNPLVSASVDRRGKAIPTVGVGGVF